MEFGPYSMIVGTRRELEDTGWVLGEGIRLNDCCSFQLWLRDVEIAVQVTSRCLSCLAAMRELLADPEQARCLPDLPSTGRMLMVFYRAGEHDAAAPAVVLEDIPSARYVAR